ncbi:MAG: CheR family methyltransferase [Gallionella sp.]|nr:CheR family methyltransferase [Gallionella sp.]
MSDTAIFDELAQLAARRIGLHIPDNAHDRFVGTLRERAAHLDYFSLQDYRTFLFGQQANGEWEELARAFTTGETFFFRDHGQFDLLRLRLLPELIAQHRHDKTLRLWSAGCASGEEVYSLAMMVDMLLPEWSGWNILILGTDIDSAAIAKARRGRYGKWSFRMVPPDLQQRNFHLEGNEWVLDERIRRRVTLRVSNLLGESFPDSASELHDMDLILCRNVFIYFEPAATFAVAAKFTETLREGGYLLVAHTELIGHPVRELESRLFAEGVVYQRHVQVPAPIPSIRCMQVREPSSISPQEWGKARAQAWTGVTTPSLVRSAGDALNTPPVALVRAAPSAPTAEMMFKEARAYADRGEFDLAEQTCHKILSATPLATAPYFLLAQLAQIKGDFNQAKECLNKAIYLDQNFVAAYLELATLCERAEDIPRAQTLRRAALGIVRTRPSDEVIEQYETTAGELAQWLAQWEREPIENHPKKPQS